VKLSPELQELLDLLIGFVKSHQSKALAPVEQRLAAVESLPAPVAERGERGEPGPPGPAGQSVDADVIKAAVLERVMLAVDRLPTPKDGRDGADGKDGRDGKDVELDVVRALVREAAAALPAPKDGAPGRDGKDGAPGADGRDGLPGKDGQHGKDGAPGVNGKDGADGINGKDGTPGRDGAPGVDGKDGAAGLAGKDGADGRDGTDGAPGAAGKDGAPGINGKDGAAGLAGKDGADGRDGERGEKGERGIGIARIEVDERAEKAMLVFDDGATAELPLLRGAKGDAGAAGMRGDKGDAGDPAPQEAIEAALEKLLPVMVRKAADEEIERRMAGIVATAVTMVPPGRDGRDGVKGAPGENGADGRDGTDGLGFDDLRVEHDGERSVSLIFERGASVKRFRFDFPVPIMRGVFKPGQHSLAHDLYTYGGSQWRAKRDTDTSPPGDDWELVVKRGRDARSHDGVQP